MKKGLAGLFAVMALALCSTDAWGWSKAGHMIVAQIAYSKLSSEARARIKPLLAPTIPGDAEMTAPVAFLQASHWADDIAFSDRVYKIAHYIDLPYSADRKQRVYTQPKEDVVRALNECVAALTDDKTPIEKQTDMLRYLIHFAADAHQPMHAVSLYSAEFPDGDRGGNEIKLPGEKSNLHHYWDTALGWLDGLHKPTTAKDLTYVRASAKILTRFYPENSFAEERVSDFAIWAQESHALAVSAAYPGIRSGMAPTEAYEAANQPLALKRITLAGYRLADLLNRVYK